MKNLKDIREKIGLTQADLAKEIGVDRSTVSKWETTDLFPQASKIPTIANILKCSTADLLCNKDV